MKCYELSLDGIYLRRTTDEFIVRKYINYYNLYPDEVKILNVNPVSWFIVWLQDKLGEKF